MHGILIRDLWTESRNAKIHTDDGCNSTLVVQIGCNRSLAIVSFISLGVERKSMVQLIYVVSPVLPFSSPSLEGHLKVLAFFMSTILRVHLRSLLFFSCVHLQ